ncbi:ParA family protein [Corynebacterium rouxii]|uniref:ParA family protein n=2 Tax=Corynebacterium rouxii TaxID=2719119 RepID=A0A6I8M927_9CORY|nr:ParA family protein [Corynebacterium rouxii]VZH84020.1 ParA family protein [Corynebacterium rouxii]
MTSIVSILQTKGGGTGKTTTAMMLAFALSARGENVLVLDSDKQSSATDWAEAVGDEMPFIVEPVSTARALESAMRRYADSDYSFVFIDTPPGSNAIVSVAATESAMVLVPTSASPLDLRRTQATLDALAETSTPIAVVLVNVNPRERILDEAHAALSAHTRAALADTVIPSRAATRRAGSTLPSINTKPFTEWRELADELTAAF